MSVKILVERESQRSDLLPVTNIPTTRREMTIRPAIIPVVSKNPPLMVDV